MIKLQHMSVIFIIVMLPIILVLSYYISMQIDTINLQTQYDTKLNDATHDAMEAFQINTRNNEYSTIADSTKRDVQAAVNAFYTSLASNIGLAGASKVELQPYIPAILCTMYDGYYLSSSGSRTINDEDLLKQYMYYTANYTNEGATNLIINYSLDSYIAIYGTVGNSTVARSGYLIQYGNAGLTKINGEKLDQYRVYNPTTGGWMGTGRKGYIKDGAIWTDTNQTNQVEVTSVEYNGVSIGKETDIVTKNQERQYVEKGESKEALYYYIEAYEFSKYINEGIKLNNVIQDSNVKIKINNETIWDNTPNNKISKLPNIFNITDENPENLQSDFVNHKKEIIRLSLEKSLHTAFNNFDGIASYDYQFPKLSDEDWEKVYKNVSFITFMQGMQVGSKIYNNYSIVTSTGNEKYVDPEEIYFIDGNQYHRITCGTLSNNGYSGYRSNMFLPQSKIIGRAHEREIDADGNSHHEGENINKTGSGYIFRQIKYPGLELYACYTCMINTNYTSVYDEDGVLGNGITNVDRKESYYTALARERYCLKIARVTKVLNDSQYTDKVSLK